MTSFVFADGTAKGVQTHEDGYARYDENKVVPYSEINVEKYEKAAIVKLKEEKSIKQNNKDVITYVDVYQDGTTRVDVSPLNTTGILYEDGSQQSTMLSNIVSIAMSIAGYYMTTVQSIVTDVASIAFGMSWSEVKVTSPGSAKLSHSYSYYDKLGKAYQASTGSWLLKVDIQRRLWFRHEYSSFAGTDGLTHTSAVDFIPSTGYSAVQDESKPYYYDDTYINNLTYERYVYNQPTYYSVYQYIY